MFDIILFDMDGTLNDSYSGIVHSVAHALDRMGIEPPSDLRELTPFIGPPLSDSFRSMYGMSESDAWRAVEYYREYYKVHGIFDLVVYDGVEAALKKLKSAGKTLAVATSKPEIAAKQIVERFGLAQYFDLVAGASMDTTRIHKHQVVEYALTALNADRARTVLVGDKHHDVEGAKACGISCIGVLYGYGTEQELKSAGADYIAATPADAVGIILGE